MRSEKTKRPTLRSFAPKLRDQRVAGSAVITQRLDQGMLLRCPIEGDPLDMSVGERGRLVRCSFARRLSSDLSRRTITSST